MAIRFGTHPPGVVLQEELESVQKRAARFVKLGVWLAFLDNWNGNPSRKGGKTIDLCCYIKVLKVKPVYKQMTLSPKLGIVEISTLWHFRLPLLIQMFIKVASSPSLKSVVASFPCWITKLFVSSSLKHRCRLKFILLESVVEGEWP